MKLHQSCNKIIVTELNPMSEAPEGEYFLVKLKTMDCLIEAKLDKANQRIEMWFGTERSVSVCEGWFPMPVYDPSEKSPEDLYEKVRKLNAQQYSELFSRSLRG